MEHRFAAGPARARSAARARRRARWRRCREIRESSTSRSTNSEAAVETTSRTRNDTSTRVRTPASKGLRVVGSPAAALSAASARESLNTGPNLPGCSPADAARRAQPGYSVARSSREIELPYWSPEGLSSTGVVALGLGSPEPGGPVRSGAGPAGATPVPRTPEPELASSVASLSSLASPVRTSPSRRSSPALAARAEGGIGGFGTRCVDIEQRGAVLGLQQGQRDHDQQSADDHRLGGNRHQPPTGHGPSARGAEHSEHASRQGPLPDEMAMRGR